MFSLCSPAIIYVIFSATQIIIDLYRKYYNTAVVKTFVMIMITILLNILCQRGLDVISWIIVFTPFILMTVIVSLLLYFFGLNATTGAVQYVDSSPPPTYTLMDPDTLNDNSYNDNDNDNEDTQTNYQPPPPPPLNISSSPAYQSL